MTQLFQSDLIDSKMTSKWKWNFFGCLNFKWVLLNEQEIEEMSRKTDQLFSFKIFKESRAEFGIHQLQIFNL